jgi:hypothetical protein
MARVVRREVRRRGFFGWVFLIIFLGFNALMAAWMIGAWNIMGNQMGTSASDAERAGTAIGGVIASGVILWIWVLGAIVTGLLALLTRGSKTVIEEY